LRRVAVMRKKDVIRALALFGDEEELMLGSEPLLTKFTRICGRSQYAMVYKCVLEPGHKGQCFCACKRVHFTPDTR